MAGDTGSGERVTVKTYVSAEQRDIWREAASALDMTLSEFVASMVQAGRRDLESTAEEPAPEDATPGGEGLEERVLDVLATEGPLEWDELVDEFVGDFESELDDTLGSLVQANRVDHSARTGEYTLNGDHHE